MPDEPAPKPSVPPSPAASTRSPARIAAVDFTRPSKFTKDQERRLFSGHETFCRTAGTRLSSELRTAIDFEAMGHMQLTWTSAAAELPQGSIAAVLDMLPINRRMLMAVEPQLVLVLIERLLGGEVKPPPAERRLTDVDMALARQVFEGLIDQLSIVWQDMVDVTLSLGGFEADAESAMLAPLSEPTWLLTIEARVGGTPFTIMLAIPYTSIAPIVTRLPQGAHDGVDRMDTSAGARVHAAIGEAEIELRAEVGSIELTAEDVLTLGVGDVIRLGAGSGHGVTMYAGDVPVHRGKPGSSATRRAVQVLGRAGGEA